MYTLKFFVFNFLHLTNASTEFDVVTIDNLSSPEEAYAWITAHMEKRCRYDDDGFNRYVKFQLTCPDGIVETFQFDFSDDFRTYVLGDHTVDGELISTNV